MIFICKHIECKKLVKVTYNKEYFYKKLQKFISKNDNWELDAETVWHRTGAIQTGPRVSV